MQEAHCEKYLGIGFDEWVGQEVAVKAKKFNLPFGAIETRDEVGQSVDDELAAIDYFNASRGE